MAMPMTAVRSQNRGQCRGKELRAYPVVRYITSPVYRADPGFRKRKRTLCRIRQTPFVDL